MSYTVEVINWVWQSAKTRDDMFYFLSHSHPRLKRFRTQKAAREWLEKNGFEPVFKRQKRPFMYRSAQGGMEARIMVAENNPYGFMPKGWFPRG